MSLHQVHDEDGGRIRYQRICEIDGKPVDYKNIDKAYDDGERTVVITDEDLKSLPAERSREIEVVEFVPTEQIDPIMFDKSYYLEPDSASNKAYVLLRRTLESTDKTADRADGAAAEDAARGAARVRRRAHGADAAVERRGARGELPVARRAREDLVEGARPLEAARREPRLGLRARAVRRRVPAGAAHPHRGQARAGRRDRHRRHVRRTARGGRGRRGHRPHGGAAAVDRVEARRVGCREGGSRPRRRARPRVEGGLGLGRGREEEGPAAKKKAAAS